MTLTTLLGCDGCGSEIGHDDGGDPYYLVLSARKRPKHPTKDRALLYAIVPDDRHFCSENCIAEWCKRYSAKLSEAL